MLRRRWVLAIVTVTALGFLLAGTAFGHYVVPRSMSDRAECFIMRRDLIGMTYFHPGRDGVFITSTLATADKEPEAIVDLYNQLCR